MKTDRVEGPILPEFPDPSSFSRIRLGELLGSLSYALDITGGQSEGHSVRSCWIGMQIADALRLSKEQKTDLYFMLLLKDVGCSANSAKTCEIFRTDELAIKKGFKRLDRSKKQNLPFALKHLGRGAGPGAKISAAIGVLGKTGKVTRDLVQTRCHRGAEIAAMMRFNRHVADGIQGLDEHWDGRGQPYGLAGRDIPLFSRIALLAQVVDVFHEEFGPHAADMEVAVRKGKWFDPMIVEAFLKCSNAPGFWDVLRSPGIEQIVFSSEPAHQYRAVDDTYLDEVAMAFAYVIDAKSPFTHGHSQRVSFYADLICQERGYGPQKRRWMRRAALLHDIGKLGVSNMVLDKPGRLTDDEFRQIQRHATMTQQILGRISAFGSMATIAAAHHERLDGTGYPNGLTAVDLTEDMRILAVADIFDALTADRPYKGALPLAQAYEIMDSMAGTGIDPDCYGSLKSAVVQHDLFAGEPALRTA